MQTYERMAVGYDLWNIELDQGETMPIEEELLVNFYQVNRFPSSVTQLQTVTTRQIDVITDRMFLMCLILFLPLFKLVLLFFKQKQLNL